jgi:uncharacterized protein
MASQNDLSPLTSDLRDWVRREETLYARADHETDSLWDHLERVSRLAERLGKAEGVDLVACKLAGLFHDAGKFSGGRYHDDERPEEEGSVECLRKLGEKHGLDSGITEQVAEAILQLYRDDPDLSPLARVLFDADNLDKLGPLGVANSFVKFGLRGRGVSSSSLYRLTVELTYARHAPRRMATKLGRQMAEIRAPATIRFVKDLLSALRDDGLYDFHVEEMVFDGLTLDVVAPASCQCGGKLERSIWEVSGIKCSEIHLRHACTDCEESQEMRFCRPRLI